MSGRVHRSRVAALTHPHAGRCGLCGVAGKHGSFDTDMRRLICDDEGGCLDFIMVADRVLYLEKIPPPPTELISLNPL